MQKNNTFIQTNSSLYNENISQYELNKKRKEINIKLSNAKKSNKTTTCKLCGKSRDNFGKFCNSHSIPERFLKNIALNVIY